MGALSLEELNNDNPEKVLPETLHQLLVSVLSQTKYFELLEGMMPFRMRFKDKEYYVYSKNFSSAYFKDR